MMNSSILAKFFDKCVEICVNGTPHCGILTDCPNEGVVVLKHQENDWDLGVYGDLYVSIADIDTIRGRVFPKTFQGLEGVDIEEERQKIRKELHSGTVER